MANENPRTILNNPELKLYTKNSNDQWATLQFTTNSTGRKRDDNVVEITVWTNEPSDADKSIKAAMDMVTFSIFINNLRQAIAANVSDGNEFMAPVTNFDKTRWVGKGKDAKPDGTYTDAKLMVGKDKEGRVWLALLSGKSGRPSLKFIFHVNKFRNLVRRDGSKLSEAELSVYAAEAYAKILENTAYYLLSRNYVEPEQNQNQNQGNRNYNNGGNNNYQQRNNNYQNNQGNNQPSGGYNNNSNQDVIDDDIPW